MLGKKHPRSFPQTPLRTLVSLVKSFQGRPNGPATVLDNRAHFMDQHCLIVDDRFPKSSVHRLIIPRDTTLLSLNDLTFQHVQLLTHMREVGLQHIQSLRSSHDPRISCLKYIIGFHAIPSLPMLHAHLISLDLESEFLKKKKHYNSFATRYFLPIEDVIQDLGAHQAVTLNQNVEYLEKLEDSPLACLWCGAPFANMPLLKAHLPTCTKNASRTKQ